jgi:phenylalanyl-tRNA synthetase alpha chain
VGFDREKSALLKDFKNCYYVFMIKGNEHPLMKLMTESIGVFSRMGFEVSTGPEMEDEWHNFDALNVPKDHPARDMQDTFYIKDKPGFVLRTHATNSSARSLEDLAKSGKTEGAFISVGKVFRNEATDATHEMQFFQIDGCMVGPNVSLANMKAVLLEFYKQVLGEDVLVEFRPSFFPFTEPSVEIHTKFKGKWLEMMGGGMIHPEVLKNVGLDPEKVQGFAFGGGLDRVAMVKWQIPDVRYFYQGDLRINQF